MASKNIKAIQAEIKTAVDAFNASHKTKLEYVKSDCPKASNIKYVALYKYGTKQVNILGCAKTPHMAGTSKDDLDYLDEYLETIQE